MYIVVTNITFFQQPTTDYPSRRAVLHYDFVTEYEASDSWADLTNKAKITMPKNIRVRFGDGQTRPTGAGVGETDNINLGGFSDNVPLFLKGDKVTIEGGYKYFDVQGNQKVTTSVLFTGFISQVTSKKPVVLELEDNMWKLKQIIAPNKAYPATATLEDILRDLLAGTDFTVNALTKTTFGAFRTQNETVCEVLARLRKDYHFESYFRGNELRSGSIVYLESDAVVSGKKIFKFQQNIISDELDYKRKDDIRLSAVAYSINRKELEVTTKSGKQKTKHERLEVLVTQSDNGFISKVKPPGEKAEFAPNTAGERRTLYFWNVSTTAELTELATNELKKYYYTGFKGKFTTFGIPYVRMGDNVDILDDILPERNGRYKVKAVDYQGGVNTGMRQVIHLDYLITRLDKNGVAI
ncbi:hypothetical protein F0L74_09735 [Chitinophaga agrisoli]|uniref:Uncharacterized protein n=1 Tax=Chitinophaga agrisoli TaxID=2607653 RepID=A0A5B2VXP2_9BACT|nr:hypothetical protein [Chitinophaga agrisoli]KAA2242799.1 hypothetical protein F0L74_09735 [Chitinophaga agrisoli]